MTFVYSYNRWTDEVKEYRLTNIEVLIDNVISLEYEPEYYLMLEAGTLPEGTWQEGGLIFGMTTGAIVKLLIEEANESIWV